MTQSKIKLKKKTTSISPSRRCPACGQGWLKPTTVTDRFVHEEDGTKRTVIVEKVPIERCAQCGESFRGPEAARLHHEAVCRTFGFLTPHEIRELREKALGITQEEFARLTGIGLATISRWERGRLVQNRAMDRYLRLLREDPASLRYLRSISA
jgi:putative zinc finger/helix-turn-helix YgiT family protein